MSRTISFPAERLAQRIIMSIDQYTRLRYEAVPDRLAPSDWRVEAIDHESEGECYVAIFAGPDAERRAREYAAWKNGTRAV
jgi:hypothetical protein